MENKDKLMSYVKEYFECNDEMTVTLIRSAEINNEIDLLKEMVMPKTNNTNDD